MYDIIKSELKNISIYTLTTFITQLCSFLIVPLFWSKLKPNDYGIIAITEIIGVFLISILGLSLNLSITRFYYEWDISEREKRVGAIWMLSWLTIIILGPLIFIILKFLNPIIFPKISFFPYIFLGFISILISSLSILANDLLRIMNRSKLYSAYNLFSFFVKIFLNIYFIIYLNRGLYGYFISNIIGVSIIAIVSFFVLFYFSIPNFHFIYIKEAVVFSLPLIPNNILASFTSTIDKIFIQRYIGVEHLGIYFIAQKFARVVDLLHSSIKVAYVPFAFKNIATHKDDGIKTVSKLTIFFLFPVFFAGFAISLLIDNLIYFVNQPLYFPVVNYVPLLVGVSLINSLYVYYSLGIFISKKTSYFLIPTIIRLLMLILCNFLLIPQLQLTGVIISQYISISCFIAVSLLISQKIFGKISNYRTVFILTVIMVLFYSFYSSMNIGSSIIEFGFSLFLILLFFLTTMMIFFHKKMLVYITLFFK